jgi:hypothetical protein
LSIGRARDKDIYVCCDAGAEECGDDAPQCEVAHQDARIRATAALCAAGLWLDCADSTHKGVASRRQVARSEFFNSAFQFDG